MRHLAEMGLISPGRENLLDFLRLRQVLSTYDGDLSDPLWWPQERPVPMRVARGPLGIALPSMPGPKTAGTLGMVARPWSSSRLSCGERLLLRCDGNAGNSFPTTQGKDPSSRARRRKRGSSGCERDSHASSQVETGMSGNFMSCSTGVKDPLEIPQVSCN